MAANSTLGVAGYGGSFQAQTSRPPNGVEYSWQQDATSTQFYHDQLANLLSHHGSAEAYRGLERQVNLEFPNMLQLEDQVFEESDPNSLEKLLSGIDQEVFMNHPWYQVQP